MWDVGSEMWDGDLGCGMWDRVGIENALRFGGIVYEK